MYYINHFDFFLKPRQYMFLKFFKMYLPRFCIWKLYYFKNPFTMIISLSELTLLTKWKKWFLEAMAAA